LELKTLPSVLFLFYQKEFRSVLVGVMLMFWGHAGLEQARFCPMKPHLWLTHMCMEPVVLQGGASALPGDSCCGRAVLGEDRDRVSFLCRA